MQFNMVLPFADAVASQIITFFIFIDTPYISIILKVLENFIFNILDKFV